MAWWNRTSKPDDEPVSFQDIYEGKVAMNHLGKIVPIENPKEPEVVPVEPPKDPIPDLSTKPKDVVGYCFGYVCPKKHVFATFENISIDGFKTRKVCQKCGGVGKPATVKRMAESRWGDLSHRDSFTGLLTNSGWGWYNSYMHHVGKTQNWGEPLWTEYEFVHYLESPKRRKK